MYQVSLIYEVLLNDPSWDKKKTCYINQKKMDKLLDYQIMHPFFSSFKRYMIHDEKYIPLDEHDCYLGEILNLTTLCHNDFDLYQDLFLSCEQDVKYQGYAIKKSDGSIFIPKQPNKVFDIKLNIQNKLVASDNEHEIRELIHEEKACFQANLDLLNKENMGAIKFIQILANNTTLNRN